MMFIYCSRTHITVFKIKILDGCFISGSEKTIIFPFSIKINTHQTADGMSLAVEITLKFIIAPKTILTDRCP